MSGSQIGGAVGYAAGAIVGSFVPGLGTAVGGQLGYALGSAIGGYIDPTQVKGPRITDAAGQTSNVGVPLPFGYGIFPTAGNVIWADELKEQVKRQRQGKGGGTKTTTYTYTRSYAIGICEGPIYGYVQIKRNGKLVYTSDPDAPVNDKDYSAKWLQKVTLYYGNEDQMPDSTIEAVVGAGNVAAFRGLAYIVVENDDLTDLAGAIPQYEFVVNATLPSLYLTSKPYSYGIVDDISLAAPSGQSEMSNLIDDISISEPEALAGTFIVSVLPYTGWPPEYIGLATPEAMAGDFRETIKPYGDWPPENISLNQPLEMDGQFYQSVVEYIEWIPEGINLEQPQPLEGQFQ